MKIKFCGAAKIVTGSCHLLDTGKTKVLIDCGMYQGSKETTRKNYEDFLFDPSSIDALIVTHGHIDHCGLIPKLVAKGFGGNIYCTESTADLIPVMLEDSAHIQESDTEHENRRRRRKGLEERAPLYTKEDVTDVLPLIKGVRYETDIRISDDVTVRLREAGHIIGSAMAVIHAVDDGKTKKIVFTGDIGQWDVPIIKDPVKIEDADFLIMESTYGDRVHEEPEPRSEILLRCIKDTVKRGGRVMIPSFALERTQEIIYSLFKLRKEGRLPDIPIFIDSPLAIRATEVFREHTEVYDEEAQELGNPFEMKGLVYTLSAQESKDINDIQEPCVIIAGSGMCTAGRIRHHFKHGLWDPKNTVIFVGYQAEGTLGRYILEGNEMVRMMGMEIKVGADIKRISSFSAHADYKELLAWLEEFSSKPEKVFMVHGDAEVIESFSHKVQEIGFTTHAPELGEEVEI
ncbi:MAG: MBL fold metallo-hydrolase RNA specificity domain-containing protein [Candidatus Muiribacteriaceae bacterium]